MPEEMNTKITLTCPTCGKKEYLSASRKIESGIDLATAATHLEWKVVMDFQMNRIVIFCSQECQDYNTSKGGTIYKKLRRKPCSN